jgi:hypothetical protein
MARRDTREARILGLWSASWLAVLLVAGLVRLGDLSLQWPVLLVPVVWALVALRRRPDRHRRVDDAPYDEEPYDDAPYDEEPYDDEPYAGGPAAPFGERTDTVERPALRPRRFR